MIASFTVVCLEGCRLDRKVEKNIILEKHMNLWVLTHTIHLAWLQWTTIHFILLRSERILENTMEYSNDATMAVNQIGTRHGTLTFKNFEKSLKLK